MGMLTAIRGRADALGSAVARSWSEASDHPEADDLEALAGVWGAFTVGLVDVTFKTIEVGNPVTSRNVLVGLGATILTSIGATVFYGKSRELRRDE